MAKKKFNPGDFLQKEKTPYQAPSTTSIPTDDLATDIQSLVEQVEASGIDITVGYDRWRDIGFALVEALGENGRDFFHRLSRFNADYDQAEADKQYTACLRSRKEGITPRSLFYFAQQHGITIHSAPTIASEARQSKTIFPSVSSTGDLEDTVFR